MSPISRKVRLEFNSFYIAGSHNVDVPQAANGTALATNRHCINVGCRMWQDAEIWIALGRRDEVHLAGDPVLDCSISTPDRQVILFDANHPELMRMPVTTINTRIRVWTNHPTEPDEVIVAVGG